MRSARRRFVALRANRHEVFALARSPDSARALKEIDAEAVIADALDVAVKAAVGRIRPDAVINELTSLPQHYTPAEMLGAPTPLVQAMLWYPWPRNRH